MKNIVKCFMNSFKRKFNSISEKFFFLKIKFFFTHIRIFNTVLFALSFLTIFHNHAGAMVIDAMESIGYWTSPTDGVATASLSVTTGYVGNGLLMNYNLGSNKTAWVQFKLEPPAPMDFTSGDHIRFHYKSVSGSPNSIEIGIQDTLGNNYFVGGRTTSSAVTWWTYVTLDLKNFEYNGAHFPDFSKVKALFVSVVNASGGDQGGSGAILMDELELLNLASRPIPTAFEMIIPNGAATQKAVQWVAQRQQPTGLLKSWQEEAATNAYLYDQALGIRLLTDTNSTLARTLVDRIIQLQNPGGYWYDDYDYTNLAAVPTTNTPIGSNAWMVFALAYHGAQTGYPAATNAAIKGANWLATLQRSDGGVTQLSLTPQDPPTEGDLDVWWAFHVTGLTTQADKLRDFMLGSVWDDSMGRFKSSDVSYDIFLDNQTWGAPFLAANCRSADALRSLSYAVSTLSVTSPVGTTYGFDGAGPFAPWFEGTGQYVAAGGQNCQNYYDQISSQQAPDGGIPNSTIDFTGYIVWLSTMHGIAPTCWFYFASIGGPFNMPNCSTPAPVPTTNLGLSPTDIKLIPNKIGKDHTVCQMTGKPVHQSRWKVFDVSGEIVRSLDFRGDQYPCWKPEGLASGLYIVKVDLVYDDGTSGSKIIRFVIMH